MESIKLDLKTLEYVKLTMDICSDHTHTTKGYKELIRLIEETKLNNLLKPDVSVMLCGYFDLTIEQVVLLNVNADEKNGNIQSYAINANVPQVGAKTLQMCC